MPALRSFHGPSAGARALAALATLLVAPLASAQDASSEARAVSPAGNPVVWAPAPGVVVVVADSAALDAAFDPVEAAEPAGVLLGTGVASYYGERFRGRRTASGERFNPDALTAAHRRLPFGTRLRVTNLRNDRSVIVRINDRGPFTRGRVIDLSKAAARRIGMIASGTARVRIERL